MHWHGAIGTLWRMTIEIPSALSAQREPLISGLNTLGLDGDRLSEPLLQYLALMLKWNATYNLTAITEPYEMVVKHVLDSAAMHASVRDLAAQGGSIAVLGAGAGLPGIVLSVIYPELHVTMLESAGKKVRFMREAIRQLGLPHARAEHVRIEAYRPEVLFDAITARALATLPELIRLGAHLLKPGGELLAMKAVFPAEEIANLPAPWQVVADQELVVPFLQAQRRLMRVAASHG